MKKNLSLAVTPSVKLRPSQARLYEFITKKYQAGETINLMEVIQQYSEYGNRYITNGTPRRYTYDWKEHVHYLAPFEDEELRLYAVQWFIRNLGIFVVKGLLTAVPTMELRHIQIEDVKDLENTER